MGRLRCSPLRSALYGYEYQDIMPGIKPPDLLLGSLAYLTVEKGACRRGCAGCLVSPTGSEVDTARSSPGQRLRSRIRRARPGS